MSIYLLTDRNYVSKSAVRLEFLVCYFRRGWNFRVVWVSFVPGTSRVIYIGKEPCKPNARRRGHLVFLAEVGQGLVGFRGGVEDSRPVNPMHFGEGTWCFSLKWYNDWLG